MLVSEHLHSGSVLYGIFWWWEWKFIYRRASIIFALCKIVTLFFCKIQKKERETPHFHLEVIFYGKLRFLTSILLSPLWRNDCDVIKTSYMLPIRFYFKMHGKTHRGGLQLHVWQQSSSSGNAIRSRSSSRRNKV